jgi:glycosyltransferase involved in cell wall biosynthesis
MIWYWPGADHPVPSGGVKTHYQHVAILRSMGLSASILHIEPGFRCTWFPNDVPVVAIQDAQFAADDIVVTNEIGGPVKLVDGLRTVVFNQNCHYTFRNYPIPPLPGMYVPYTDPTVVGTMVLTPYCRDALKLAFPNHPVTVVPHGIDGEKWKPGIKKRQIAFMPRKHADEAQAVFGFLHYAGVLNGWDVVAINGKTEDETAAILAESQVFFAFGYPEGGTLPPFEAMAAGCAVVGYGGYASDKWITEFGGYLVPSGNTMDFVRAAAFVLGWNRLTEWGEDQRRAVLKGLSPQAERDALYAFWSRIVAGVR